MDPVMYRTAGPAELPSPSIWADCNRSDIQDMGTGYWFHEDFLGGVVADTSVDGFQFFGTSATAAGTNAFGGILQLGATGGTDNDEGYIAKEPFCETVLNSGNSWWFEVKMAPVTMSATDSGGVVGLGEAAFLVDDAIAINCDGLITESFVGFRWLDVDTDSIDAIYQLDDGAEVSILADVTEAAALGDDAAALTSGLFHKYGMRFDGKETLFTYVDGVEVAQTKMTTAFPLGVDLGLIIGCKTGDTAAQSMYVAWGRGAFEINS